MSQIISKERSKEAFLITKAKEITCIKKHVNVSWGAGIARISFKNDSYLKDFVSLLNHYNILFNTKILKGTTYIDIRDTHIILHGENFISLKYKPEVIA